MAGVLNTLGVTAQILGVVVAFVGLWKTWHEHAAGEPFWGPLVMWARAVSRSTATWAGRMIRRLLRRRPETIAIQGTAAATFSAFGNIRVRVNWGPLPETTEAALQELHRRTVEMSDRQANAIDRLDDAIGEMRTDIAARATNLAAEIGRVENLSRHVAVGGVQLEATGLFLVLLGLALQGMAFAVK